MAANSTATGMVDVQISELFTLPLQAVTANTPRYRLPDSRS